METINIALVGYGNVGRGVEEALKLKLKLNADTELVAVLTRRPEQVRKEFVLTSGVTGEGNKQILEYQCQLESNPEFTANVLVACARAAFRLCKDGRKGAFTMLDIPPGYLSPHSAEILRKSFM